MEKNWGNNTDWEKQIDKENFSSYWSNFNLKMYKNVLSDKCNSYVCHQRHVLCKRIVPERIECKLTSEKDYHTLTP